MTIVPTNGDDLKRWISVAERITSTTALIAIVLYLVWANTGDRARALEAAKENAVIAAAAATQAVEVVKGHVITSNQEAAVQRMILIQICINTAKDRIAVNQCLNYR